MFSKILIANRGEIACRVIRTAHRLGVACVAVYSDADEKALHVQMADEAVHIGPAPVGESYLKGDTLIAAALKIGAQAIHPGYGFLSENPGFVDACTKAGLTFIGPSVSAISAMGLKDAAKALMQKAGVPVVPGYHGDNQDTAFLHQQADSIGYPVLIKARAGGGGKGMRKVERSEDFREALASAQREGQSSFGDPHVLIEKYVGKPRHIEVQVFGDRHGNAVHLFERDCSLQRRHQKVIEEAPAPGMTPAMRQRMGEAAVKAALAVGYEGAGTVEFIVDSTDGLDENRFYFMEMNTRLQVEHPVTEAITGLDLVEWQLRVASGEELPLRQSDLTINGHAFEARLYAEDAEKGFLPATGTLHHLHLPASARCDTGVRQGDTISPYYDPMIAKIIVHGPTRASALQALDRALSDARAMGCVTNLAFLRALTRHDGFKTGDVDTGLIGRDQEALTAHPAPQALDLALAALKGLRLLDPPASHDPFAVLRDFRAFGEARHHATLVHRGEALPVSLVTRGPNSYDAQTPSGALSFTVEAVAGDALRVTADGQALDATLVAAGGEIGVFTLAGTQLFTLRDDLDSADDDNAAEDVVRSPMPGLVKLVTAKTGQTVAKGDALLVLEAMKMEHTLRAPRDGVIAEMLASSGEQVQEGVTLVRMAEA